ncbi:PA14 domain protein [Pirellulimonas nuda]|uniref:PA14 domain protein n=1 Tax=Pirellulimonas nuda TaxID=2528009 RepID=A0A518DEE4_9BACT|nr:DUF1592 domain-containing protein [Pirellulimonas nuda]QDU89855.1 PA14 domain protein [Pirellulimonas nuda]
MLSFSNSGWPAAAMAACGLLSSALAAGPDRVGAAAFADKCAACHGADGQGESGAFESPLAGDLSVAELTRVIERTMPEGSPEDCVGEEAEAIAGYVFESFYSPAARARAGHAPRIVISRLTVPQHRNALADLVGRFTPGRENAAAGAPGWHAEYYKSDGMNKAQGDALQRVDAAIDFDFDTGSPAEGIGADQFSIVWRGAVSAPHTGDYEFRLRTQNGARLYLNRDGMAQGRIMRDDGGEAGNAPLIDQWVGSGKMREDTARVFLLAGRRYPIRVEFFKYLDKTASVRLEWRTPHGAWEVLGQQNVDNATPGRTFVLQTPLPADDRSLGYEQGSSVSQAWLTAISEAALETADEVVAKLPALAGRKADRLPEFLSRFVAAAYRRPLTPAEQQLFREELFATTDSAEGAVRKGVLLALTSPHFLYVDLSTGADLKAGADQSAGDRGPDPHAVAARLALALWDSIPDAQLAAAADKGKLKTAQQIEAQAARMLQDPRTRAKVQEFFADWLELDERDLAKDQKLYPDFDEPVAADLRRSLELFLDRAVWEGDSDYRQLLLADYLLLNDRLAALYGEGGAADASAEPDAGGFRRYVFSDAQRSGVLTHPYLLSAFAYHNNTSPIHRGVFLTRRIVGRTLRPPPVAVAFSDDSFAADLSMREKVTELTRDQACMSCHEVINPLGFALEHFDAVGRWRQHDGVKPIDSRGLYTAADGATVELSRARDIAAYAAGSTAAHRAFIKHLFHHLVKQDPSAYGPDAAEALRRDFTANGFAVRGLIEKIAVVSASHGLSDDSAAAPETSL